MGIADFILAGEGDLYDMNEYHMLAHIIIRNKVDDYGKICSRLSGFSKQGGSRRTAPATPALCATYFFAIKKKQTKNKQTSIANQSE